MKDFTSLGMFIVDEFEYRDARGELTGQSKAPQIGGGGTYAAIGARIWLQPNRIGMIIDRGKDFDPSMQTILSEYGTAMWHFRDQMDHKTTRAVNRYRGDHREWVIK